MLIESRGRNIHSIITTLDNELHKLKIVYAELFLYTSLSLKKRKKKSDTLLQSITVGVSVKVILSVKVVFFGKVVLSQSGTLGHGSTLCQRVTVLSVKVLRYSLSKCYSLSKWNSL